MASKLTSCKVDLVVKFGGSAITNKNKLETLDEESLNKAAELVQECHERHLTCIVVHGAGSFGHYQAREYKVKAGWTSFPETSHDTENVKRGFCITRKSVTTLHLRVIDSLLSKNIPAVGISACGSWQTKNGDVVKYDQGAICDLLESRFIPVLHGDCVLDDVRGCTILSGDTIIQNISKDFTVNRVVFLTSIDGVFDSPPENNPEAKLVKTITVNKRGEHSNTSVADGRDIVMKNEGADVTGGMTLKFTTAVDIARESAGTTEVFICKIGSRYAANVCLRGRIQEPDTEDSGTEIIYTC